MMILLLASMVGLQDRPLEAAAGWEAHKGEVGALAFDASGEMLTSVGGEGIRRWKVPDGARTSAVDAPGAVFAIAPRAGLVAISTQGLISNNDPASVRVLDASDGKEKIVLQGAPHRVEALAFSPDAGRLAASGDLALCVYDLATGKRIARFDGHSYGVDSIAWSPDGHLVAARSEDDRIHLWRIGGREERRFPLEKDLSFTTVGISGDGALIAGAASGSEPVVVWELNTGKEIASLALKGATYVSQLAFSPGGAWLGVVGHGKRPSLFSAKTWTEFPVAGTHRAVATTAAWSADARWLATGDREGAIRLWKLR